MPSLPPLDQGQARQFLALLGRDASTARLRAFPHRLNPRRHDPRTNPSGIKARKGPFDLAAAERWQQEERGIYLVINEGGDVDADITSCVAFWVEWDNKPLSWQLSAWQQFGLGEPTAIITTGGKSAHLYWVLTEPISPDRWAPIQSALIEVTGADPVNRNPSRVMRLPGAHYLGPDGQATGQARIAEASGHRYSADQVEEWLAAAPQPEHRQPIPLEDEGIPLWDATDIPPRPPGSLRLALEQVPLFSHGSGQYQQLVGLAMRLHVEVGAAEAQALLAATCCQAVTDLPSYFIGQPTRIQSGSVWAYLRDTWGIDIRRHDLRGQRPGQAPPPPAADPQAATPPQQEQRRAILTLAETRERLAYAISSGASRADLEAECLSLASAADLPPASLRSLLRELRAEHEAQLAIGAEAAQIKAAAARAESAAALSLDYLLPKRIAWAIATRTRALPVDDVAAACCFIVCISSVVKLGSEMVAAEALDYRVPLNLYAALVARSGAKKSPTSRLLVAEPTKALRLELAREHDRAMAAWKEDTKGMKPTERPDPPRAAYLSVSDATSEALAAQLQEQENRGLGLLFNRDELAGMFGSLNAYRKGRGGDEQQLLEAYDGAPFHSLRVAAAGGGRFYSRCHLSIWGTIQPDVLRDMVAGGDASGLWARFLFVPLPEVIVPIPLEDSETDQWDSEEAASILADTCRAVYTMPRRSLYLTPEGRAAFVAYEQRTQEQVRASAIPAQGALWGKAAGKVLRIAGLLHLIRLAAGEASGNDVGSDEVERAAAVVDHLNSWTLSLHQSVADGATDDLMRLIHGLSEAAGRGVGWRDVSQRLSKAQRQEIDSAAASAAMQALAELGAGEVATGARGAATYRATGRLP
jgi:hypothetical protein